jgi:hypothetical protein
LEPIPVDPALLESANRWFDISWYGLLAAGLATALAATATVIFLILQFWSSGVRERHTEWRTSELELQTAQAKKDTAMALERAAKADERTEEMRQKIGPRRIEEKIFLAKLAGVPKKPVIVSHAPDDPDSYFLANDVLGALNKAQWEGRYVGTTVESVKMCGASLGGVLVLSKTASNEEFEDLQKPLQERRKTAWLSLTDALRDSLAGHSVGLATCPFIEEGALQVVVSPRWVFFPKQ